MYKYELIFSNNQHFDFESKYHISVLNIMDINGARIVYFEDTMIGLNVNHVKKIIIDGKPYTLQIVQ